jgi:tetrahydromethanopterin S-methyltransferase subunit B
MAKGLKNSIKDLYIDGYNPSEIELRLKCDRSTVYYHKKKDKDIGIDWDELRDNKRFNLLSSSENFEEDKKEFLTTLFNAFKKRKDEILSIDDPSESLKQLNSFANNYKKFLDPSTHDCKSVADKSARKCIEVIIDLAVEKEESNIIEFLSDHFEQITTKTVNEVKKLR